MIRSSITWAMCSRWPFPSPLLRMRAAPWRLPSGRLARRSAAGMSCSLSPNIADIDIGRPSSAASDWSTTWLIVVSCWTRAAASEAGRSAPRYPGSVQNSSK